MLVRVAPFGGPSCGGISLRLKRKEFVVLRRRASKEEVRRVQELRRSNASTRHKSKKAYKRKPKHGAFGSD